MLAIQNVWIPTARELEKATLQDKLDIINWAISKASSDSNFAEKAQDLVRIILSLPDKDKRH